MKNEINDIGNLFKDSFEGYTTSPSSAVWNSIKHKLWLKGFLAFSVNSFNVYYAALIATTILFTGVSIYSNNTENTSNCNENLKIEQSGDSDSMSWLSFKKNYYRLSSRETNTKNEIHSDNEKINNISIEKKNTDNSNHKSNNTISITDNSSAKINTEDNSTISKTVKPSSGEVKNQIIEKIEKTNSTNEVQNSGEKVSREKANISSTIEDFTNKNNSTVSVKSEERDSNSKLQNENSTNPDKELLNVNEAFYDTIIVTINDTVLYVDTVEVFDTIRYKEPVKKHRKRNKSKLDGLSVDLVTGIENTSFNYLTDVDTLSASFNNSSLPALSFSLGANVSYEIDKWRIQTGVSYLQLNENFIYSEEINTIDTTGSFWEYTPTGYTHSFDTVGYQFQIDTLNGDTFFVYVPMIIDSIIMVYDSSKIYQTKTTSSIKDYNIRNKYTYLNIPLMFGYNFYNNKKLSLTGKLGGNIGILLNAKGKSFSLADNKSIIDFDINSLPFVKTNIRWMASINMYYKLEKNMGVYVEPYYRGSLNSMFDSNHLLGLKANAIGIYAGFRFYL